MYNLVPLIITSYVSVGESEHITLTSNIDEDINLICDKLREDLHQEVSYFRQNMNEDHPEYIEFEILPGRTEAAAITIRLVAKRQETTEEMAKRITKEEKTRLRKEAIKQKKKEADMATIRKLAKLHNLPLAIIEPTVAPGGRPAHETNAGNQS